jgi:hypothetical protein
MYIRRVPRERMTREQRELDNKIDVAVRSHFASPSPAVVYHYTSRFGLEKIVEGRAIRATQHETLEDKLECVLAGEYIPEIVAELRGSKAYRHTAATDSLLGRAPQFYRLRRNATPKLDFHVSCFCLDAEREYLWREFGRKGEGYCLGLRVLADESHSVAKGTVAFTSPVEYRREAQLEILRSGWLKVLKLLNGYSRRDDAVAVDIALVALGRVTTIADIVFKRESYSREQEWRLLVWPTESYEGLEQYQDGSKRGVLWPLRAGKKLPYVESVHVGANTGRDAVAEVTEMLSKRGYGGEDAPPMPRIERSVVEFPGTA